MDQPRDELWWVKDKLRREDVEVLPPTLALRKEVEVAKARIADAGTEDEVRAIVAEINTRIRQVNSRATAGPPTSQAPFDVEQVVASWRERRS